MTIIQFVTEMIRLLSKFQANKPGKKLFLDWLDEFTEMANNEYPPF